MSYRPTIRVALPRHSAPSGHHPSHIRQIANMPASPPTLYESALGSLLSSMWRHRRRWALFVALYAQKRNLARLPLCRCFQNYALMAKQSLPVRFGLPGYAISVVYLMVVPSGLTKLLHE
ncbi:hypothetical protein BCV72DRAFT_331954 [Rhizopus microsporus var. microsporus]|uniref:Uncharacterized protein n=2 Tax=Rhizopus microsporus TaxID=58291 RepID=A0A2G4T8W6_RHIZD|nr:uncharacterized protein RHIMIDRAFT_288347 [Rhizopus microsporus ATCC 52813]ORE11963.1 hypothetical protein BCV72DRAFT_331954 [Rhizopus microsporus var. microsporus]PHZ17455.1 hypothetical protein RHIMIDRAFT_288347 [Rhizopus microsporus ATCC 52813]